jgi:hypothetical protein
VFITFLYHARAKLALASIVKIKTMTSQQEILRYKSLSDLIFGLWKEKIDGFVACDRRDKQGTTSDVGLYSLDSDCRASRSPSCCALRAGI